MSTHLVNRANKNCRGQQLKNFFSDQRHRPEPGHRSVLSRIKHESQSSLSSPRRFGRSRHDARPSSHSAKRRSVAPSARGAARVPARVERDEIGARVREAVRRRSKRARRRRIRNGKRPDASVASRFGIMRRTGKIKLEKRSTPTLYASRFASGVFQNVNASTKLMRIGTAARSFDR